MKELSIIKTHDITLYGGNDKYDIVLRPLCDEYLPLLYKWSSDPEVLYWTEGGEDIVRSYDKETVHDIYGRASQNAFCFLIEANRLPIGECWLQKMNISDVISMYPGLDVRRIDMAIGEKCYWGKGIGTAFIHMLVDFAFTSENIDILHCFSEDYNIRSQKVWLKNGLKLVRTDELPQPQKGKIQYHFALTKAGYIQERRMVVPEEKVMWMSVLDLQPSQLYISEGKLRLASEWFDKSDISKMDAVPIKQFHDRYLMTDGHTRAVLAYMNGFTKIPCYLDNDDLDMKAYTIDVKWCKNEGIKNVVDLTKRIVTTQQYEELWRKRCMEMKLWDMYDVK